MSLDQDGAVAPGHAQVAARSGVVVALVVAHSVALQAQVAAPA